MKNLNDLLNYGSKMSSWRKMLCWIKTNCRSAKVTGRRARKVEGGVFFVSMSLHHWRFNVVMLSLLLNVLCGGWCSCMTMDTPPLLTSSPTRSIVMLSRCSGSPRLDRADEPTALMCVLTWMMYTSWQMGLCQSNWSLEYIFSFKLNTKHF